MRLLLLYMVTTLDQFDHEGILTKLLIQPRLQLIQHRHCRTNDIAAEFFVGKILLHDLSQLRGDLSASICVICGRVSWSENCCDLLRGTNGFTNASSKLYPPAKSALLSFSVFPSRPTSTILNTMSPKSSQRVMPQCSSTVFDSGPNCFTARSRIPLSNSCPDTCVNFFAVRSVSLAER